MQFWWEIVKLIKSSVAIEEKSKQYNISSELIEFIYLCFFKWLNEKSFLTKKGLDLLNNFDSIDKIEIELFPKYLIGKIVNFTNNYFSEIIKRIKKSKNKTDVEIKELFKSKLYESIGLSHIVPINKIYTYDNGLSYYKKNIELINPFDKWKCIYPIDKVEEYYLFCKHDTFKYSDDGYYECLNCGSYV